jgi:hypothetical protein
MNGRVAGLVSRYWHRQGYTVEVGTKEGPVWSNLRCGLAPGYPGQDAIPVSAIRAEGSMPAPASTAREGFAQSIGYQARSRLAPVSGVSSQVLYCNSDEPLSGQR